MKDFDVEAYLDGSLNPSEREAFEAKMRQDSNLAEEVALYRQLGADVEMVSIRNEVSIALSHSASPETDKRKGWWLGGSLLILILVTCLFFLNKTEEAPLEQQPPKSQELLIPPPPPEIEENNSLLKQDTESTIKEEQPATKSEKSKRPIAQNDPSTRIIPPRFPAPNVRGSQAENKAWKAFLNKIWYTEYPPANAQFRAPFEEADSLLKLRQFEEAYIPLLLMEGDLAANDTFQFMKAYCLLEMGEGAEAQLHFSQLAEASADWKSYIEWYRGLSFLIAGNQEAAKPIFESLENQTKHPFQEQAKKVLNLIE